jgi:hypothetical protein
MTEPLQDLDLATSINGRTEDHFLKKIGAY